MSTVLLLIAVFGAAALQALTGFGFALIVMPLATFLIGLSQAAPLVALAGLSLYAVNLVRFRRSVNVMEVIRLAAASAPGIALGLWALVTVDERIIKPLLGLVLVVYALYALAQPRTQRVCPAGWVFPAGFLAGCLGGAYNTPGPPVIVYGSLRQWPKEEFRAILQTLFFVNGTLVVTSHGLAGNLTREVMVRYLYVVPALALGLLTGALLDPNIRGARFRQLVSILILCLGVSLLIGSTLWSGEPR